MNLEPKNQDTQHISRNVYKPISLDFRYGTKGKNKLG